MEERADERTGLVEREIIQAKDRAKDLSPRIVIQGENGEMKAYNLPVGIRITVEHNVQIEAGDAIAKRERSTTKTKDITGGLPRVVELFEARRPKDPAQVTEVDGIVDFGEDIRGKRRLIVTPEYGDAKEYLISKNKHIAVQKGDFVRAGEALTDGAIDPHDILSIEGVGALANYLVNEVQEIYRLQGVSIDDKHVEVIISQMLRRVTVIEPGDSNLLIGESVEKWNVIKLNNELISQGKKPATYEPLLLGITKAALSTESFISAASFQETTKVLTDAAVSSKIDTLRGLKENVIMGRLIPAGSGATRYAFDEIKVKEDEKEKEQDIYIGQSSIESLAGLL